LLTPCLSRSQLANEYRASECLCHEVGDVPLQLVYRLTIRKIGGRVHVGTRGGKD